MRTQIEDKNGVLWLGTDDGLNSFSITNDEYKKSGRPTFTHFKPVEGDPGSISDEKILSIYEDRAENLWIGTKIGGLNVLDRKTKRFFSYKHDPSDISSISSNEIITIYHDKSGILWVGTGNGLNRVMGAYKAQDKTQLRFFRYFSDPNDPNSLSSNDIRSIHEDGLVPTMVSTD